MCLTNVEVRVGNNEVNGVDVLPSANSLCQVLASVDANPVTVTCLGTATGRYVSIQRVNVGQAAMALCEVEVFAEPAPLVVPSAEIKNVALNKEAFHISTAAGGREAFKAVDGRTQTDWGTTTASCAMGYGTSPWWWVQAVLRATISNSCH